MAESVCKIFTFSKYDPNFTWLVPTNAWNFKKKKGGQIQETVEFCASKYREGVSNYNAHKVEKGLYKIAEKHGKDGQWKDMFERDHIPEYPSFFWRMFFSFLVHLCLMKCLKRDGQVTARV